MLDLMLSNSEVTCLFEKPVGAGFAYIASDTISPSPGNEMSSPNRFLITLALRKTHMAGLMEVISDMTYNKQSESAKRAEYS
jgi:hypothetical protein